MRHPLLVPTIPGEPGRFTPVERAIFDILSQPMGSVVPFADLHEGLYGRDEKSRSMLGTVTSRMNLKMVNHKILNVYKQGYQLVKR